jgi:formamidopyrimidine-DNA glycosylase
MPEFAEVNLHVKWLRERVTGWKISSYEITASNHFPGLKDDPDKDKTLNEFFKGATIQHVAQRGKQVVFVLSTGTMFSHLMFKGRWSIGGDDFTSNYKKHKEKPTPKSIGFSLTSSTGQRLNFHEPERMGKVHAYLNAQPKDCDELSGLGPEVLLTPETEPDFAKKEWELATFKTNISTISKSIKEFLLDQKKQSGLGNMYVCEALYQARIDPSRPAKSLQSDEADDLYNAARSILKRSMDTKLDYDEVLKVYHREKDPKGNPVEESQVGGRDTFWVPAIQK